MEIEACVGFCFLVTTTGLGSLAFPADVAVVDMPAPSLVWANHGFGFGQSSSLDLIGGFWEGLGLLI